MSKVAVYTKAGTKQEAEIKLNPFIFKQDPNPELLSMAYRAYEAKLRTAHANTLTKGEVRGGGKKPWRQKGTGKARAGSSRLPHWTGGGVAFGPTGNQNYNISMPIKAKQLALRQALSLQAKDGTLSIIEDFSSSDGKTKATAAMLGKLNKTGRGLIVVSAVDDLARRATANLPGVELVTARYLSTHAVLISDWIIITKPALDLMDDWLGVASKTPVTKNKTRAEDEAV